MEKTMVFYAVLVLFQVTLSLIGSLLPEPFYLIVYILSFLIPVAIGNMIGGMSIGALYRVAYVEKNKNNDIEN